MIVGVGRAAGPLATKRQGPTRAHFARRCPGRRGLSSIPFRCTCEGRRELRPFHPISSDSPWPASTAIGGRPTRVWALPARRSYIPGSLSSAFRAGWRKVGRSTAPEQSLSKQDARFSAGLDRPGSVPRVSAGQDRLAEHQEPVDAAAAWRPRGSPTRPAIGRASSRRRQRRPEPSSSCRCRGRVAAMSSLQPNAVAVSGCGRRSPGQQDQVRGKHLLRAGALAHLRPAAGAVDPIDLDVSMAVTRPDSSPISRRVLTQ